MWEKVNTPSAYMRRFNNAEISHNAKQEISVTYEHKLMAALSDPNLRYMASESDYYSLLSELTNRGVISGDASSEMSKNMMEVLANNKSVRDRASELFSTVSTPNDYQFLVKAVKNETRVVGGVAVVIVGVALVAGAVYVVAATGVYVATSAAFTVGGGGNCVNCHAPSNDYMVMKTFADEVGNTVLASKVFIKMKQDEAKAAIDASLSLGLISIKDTEYNNVISAMNRIIEENAGVGQ